MKPFLGQIVLFPYNFAPRGWSFCEGQVLQISYNVALCSLLGTTFGGDGMQTFALPDLRGKEPESGLRYCIAMQGEFPSRE
jgi:microcystin-dependent protein